MTPAPPPPGGFDRYLTSWLEERAQPRAPEHLLRDTVARTARTRPLPAWRLSERWIPVPLALRLAVVPRALLMLLLVSLLVAGGVAGLALGQRLVLVNQTAPALPPPAGVAGNGLIAYASGGDIWVVEPDGSNPRAITSGPANDKSPLWSPDGTRLAYESGGDFWVVEPDGSNPRAITSGPADHHSLLWSPDSTRLAYQSGDEGGPAQIIVVSADGTDPVPLAETWLLHAQAQYSVFGWYMSWSPDGLSLAVHGPHMDCLPDTECGHRIWIVAADGSGARQIGDPALPAKGPAWSPDGASIAFGGGVADEEDLYVMDANGTGVRRVTDEVPFHDSFPASWSPDGTRIVTQAGDDPDIWVVAVDGSSETNISDSPDEDDGSPSWSPDGTAIVWVSENIGGFRLWTPETGAVALPSTFGLPVWSPDGTLLAGFSSGGLVVYDRHGAVRAEVPAPAQYTFPSWQRVAAP